VVGATPWPTRIESVFAADKTVILFAQSPGFRDEYEAVSARVRDLGCTQVGLSTTRMDPEYALWRLLGAPESGVTLQHVRFAEETRPYADPSFRPCAVICTACEGLSLPAGLGLEVDYGHIRLYVDEH
jgi:hypothetical protein